MEMYWNSEPKVATNVFELGLKMFAHEPDYILRYLEFLIQQNNANSASSSFYSFPRRRARADDDLPRRRSGPL